MNETDKLLTDMHAARATIVDTARSVEKPA